MKHIPIPQRLIGTFVILIGIVGALGWIGIKHLETLRNDSERIINKRWSTLQTSFEAINQSYKNNRVLMQIFMEGTPNVTRSLLEERNRNSQQISNYLHQIDQTIDTKQERQVLDLVESRRRPYMESYLRALRLLTIEQQSDKARRVLLDESLPLLIQYQAVWEQFVNLEKNLTQKMENETKKDFERGRRMFLLLTWLAIGVTGGIATVVTLGMNHEIRTRRKAEEGLRKAGEELDERVRRRTAELLKANQRLQEEIAQRKNAQAQLALEQKKFQEIFESCPEGIFQSSMDGHLLRVNAAAAEIYGYASAEEMATTIQNVATQL
jgi:PAS domain-containing protein